MCTLYVPRLVDGELNVLEDILTDAPDQDDELYNPESEHDINVKKGTFIGLILFFWGDCSKKCRSLS